MFFIHFFAELKIDIFGRSIKSVIFSGQNIFHPLQFFLRHLKIKE